MSRLPNATAAEVVRALKRAGFVEHEARWSHRVYKHPTTGCRTVVSFHGGDIKRSLLKDIIRQAGLSEDEFRAFL